MSSTLQTRTSTYPTTVTRPALPLSTGERILAVAVAAGIWLALFLVTSNPAIEATVPPSSYRLPTGFIFLFCNIVAVFVLCARRFLWRIETSGVSRYGYAAFAFLVLQTTLLILLGPLIWFAPQVILGLVIMHFALCFAALVRAFQRKYRGELAALPFFFAWYSLLFYAYYWWVGPV